MRTHPTACSPVTSVSPSRAGPRVLPPGMAWAALAMGLLLQAAQAQPVYRIVGPDGKVTFSDKPPVTGTTTTARTSSAPNSTAGGTLPFELRQVVNRYPVTLYTSAKCGPCDTARAFLTGRGVPFTEKTVTSNEDINSLQRLFGDTTLPSATIGSQQLKGYSDAEWAQYLDAAAYPKTSLLPAAYRNVPATPLVAVQRPAESNNPTGAAAAPGTDSQAADRRLGRPAAPPPAPSENPAGIRF